MPPFSTGEAKPLPHCFSSSNRRGAPIRPSGERVSRFWASSSSSFLTTRTMSVVVMFKDKETVLCFLNFIFSVTCPSPRTLGLALQLPTHPQPAVFLGCALSKGLTALGFSLPSSGCLPSLKQAGGRVKGEWWVGFAAVPQDLVRCFQTGWSGD